VDASGGICLAPLSPLSKLSVGMIIPAICVVQLLLTFLIRLVYWYCKHGRYDDGVKVHKSPYIRTLFGFLLFSYNSIVSTLMKYFGCMRISDTQSVLRSEPAISCNDDDDDYNSMKPLFSILLVIIAFGAPIGILLGLVYNDHKKKRLHTTKFLQRYGILYEIYKPRRCVRVCVCMCAYLYLY